MGVASEPFATLQSPYQVKDLLACKDLTWDGLLHLKPPAPSKPSHSWDGLSNLNPLATSKKGNVAKAPAPAPAADASSKTNTSPLDLDIRFSLFGLESV